MGLWWTETANEVDEGATLGNKTDGEHSSEAGVWYFSERVENLKCTMICSGVSVCKMTL